MGVRNCCRYMLNLRLYHWVLLKPESKGWPVVTALHRFIGSSAAHDSERRHQVNIHHCDEEGTTIVWPTPDWVHPLPGVPRLHDYGWQHNSDSAWWIKWILIKDTHQPAGKHTSFLLRHATTLMPFTPSKGTGYKAGIKMSLICPSR